MKQNYLVICTLIGCISGSSLYADALDDLVKQKQIEQQQAEQRLKQKQETPKSNILDDIADCEQAVAKAVERRKEISKKEIMFFYDDIVTPDTDGLLHIPWYGYGKVSDFAPKGVFINGNSRFIYTKDTDYATGEKFRGNNLIYEKVGNYKYNTVMGSVNSVPAYKATSYKVSEINPKTYLKNKELSCCQYKEENKEEFKEVGVEVESSVTDFINRINKTPGNSLPMKAEGFINNCFTANHPKGANSSALCTGTNYKE